MVYTDTCRENKLNALLKEMCAEAGLSKDFSNGSLWHMGLQLYFKPTKVPEKLIQMRTGHKSLEALKSYEQHLKHNFLTYLTWFVIRRLLKAPVMGYSDTCQSSSDLVEIRGHKDNMEGKYPNNGITPLLNADATLQIAMCHCVASLTIMKRPLVQLTKPILMSY